MGIPRQSLAGVSEGSAEVEVGRAVALAVGLDVGRVGVFVGDRVGVAEAGTAVTPGLDAWGVAAPG